MKNENEQSIVLGDVEVLRVVEWQGPLVPAADFVPEAGAELWKANEEWLAPDHWEPERDLAVVALQTWVLRSAGRTILVDTGVGNGRERPGSPRFHHWQADFLGELERAGVRPEDVDLVVNTHVHADHVGGNTVDEAGEWVPAFPNAEYLIPAADDHWFGPRGGYGKGLREDDRLLYEDSVAPVHRAGQAVLWEGAHRIDEHLTLESAPRSHAWIRRPQARLRRRPRGVRRGPAAQPGPDPAAVLQQLLLHGRGGGRRQPAADPRTGRGHPGTGRPRPLRRRGRRRGPARRCRVRSRPLGRPPPRVRPGQSGGAGLRGPRGRKAGPGGPYAGERPRGRSAPDHFTLMTTVLHTLSAKVCLFWSHSGHRKPR
ncbi:hypothetical protein GCM10020254_11610 [Streptomyces goshikiensis]